MTGYGRATTDHQAQHSNVSIALSIGISIFQPSSTDHAVHHDRRDADNPSDGAEDMVSVGTW